MIDHSIEEYTFSFYGDEQIKKLSVIKLDNSNIYENLGVNVFASGGVYDKRLGMISKFQKDCCETCGGNWNQCNGHYGHIELYQPVFNPLIYNDLKKILAITCWSCHRFLMSEKEKLLWKKIFYLIEDENLCEATNLFDNLKSIVDSEIDISSLNVDEHSIQTKGVMSHLYSLKQEAVKHLYTRRMPKCNSCQTSNSKWRIADKTVLMMKQSEKEKVVFPKEVEDHFKKFMQNEGEWCFKVIWKNVQMDNGLLHPVPDPSIFFWNNILVDPPRYRPQLKFNDSSLPHHKSKLYSDVIKANNALFEIAKDKDTNDNWFKKYAQAYKELQNSCNEIYGGEKGVKNTVEKKRGLFRKFMMGKRVNFAARSVISSDPYIRTDQIGLPILFAKKLSYNEGVNEFNCQKLSEYVKNGPNEWPGAHKVILANGSTVFLNTQQSRNQWSKIVSQGPSGGVTFVGRHLMDDDLVLVNRQPTLHKSSIMAHKVRIYQTKKMFNVIRLHYSNCKTFNADFDGDEINVHLLQDEISRAEGVNIVNAGKQFLVAKDASPQRGLIQDHIVSGILLTQQNTFLNKEEFFTLVYSACDLLEMNFDIKIPPPTIFKPRMLWTGKQVISTVLDIVTHGRLPINYEGTTKIPPKLWGKHSMEHKVIVRENELVCGVLERSQYGSVEGGLVHACYDLYGDDISEKLFSIFGRLFTKFLQMAGFTCGIDDLLFTNPIEKHRIGLLDQKEEDLQVISKFTENPKIEYEEQRESLRNILTENTSEVSYLDDTVKRYTHSLASKIVDSCFSDNALIKDWPLNNFSLMTVSGAKGSKVNFSQISCLLGQQELEGKRPVTMISGKQLPSFMSYEPSSRAGGFIGDRFLTGLRPQEYFYHCMAGREGLIDTAVKTSRSGYLQRCLVKHMESLQVSYDYTVRDSDNSIVQFCYGGNSIDINKATYLTNFQFHLDNYEALISKLNPLQLSQSGIKQEKDVAKSRKRGVRNPSKYEPVSSLYPSHQYLGSVSEDFENKLDKFLKQANFKNIQKNEFRLLMYINYLKAHVDPGESVGVLASQSIGEPSTQMTLNTFHLAGRGDVNVTLGVPRMREILMVAGRPSTPSMNFPVFENLDKKAVTQFLHRFNSFNLTEILEKTKITENIVTKGSTIQKKEIQISLFFRKESLVSKSMTFKELSNVILKHFSLSLEKEISKSLKRTKLEKVKVDMDDDKVDLEEEEPKDEPERKKEKESEESEDYDEDDENNENEPKADQPEQPDDVVKPTTKEKKDDKKDKKGTKESMKSKKSFSYITDIKIGKENEIMMMLNFQPTAEKLSVSSLLEEVIKNYRVKLVESITRAVMDKNMVTTEGIDIKQIWKSPDIVQINKIKCNDFREMLTYYGVEAARNTIINEISSVFKVYGISVNKCHLDLIGDYMTFNGGVRAYNRNCAKPQTPFQKITFETSMNFLVDSALNGQYENLLSSSSRIGLGLPISQGSNCFDVKQKLSL